MLDEIQTIQCQLCNTNNDIKDAVCKNCGDTLK